MRLTEEKIEEVNKNYKQLHIMKTYDLTIIDSIVGTTVYTGVLPICSVDKLEDMIDELCEMRRVIKEVVGIY